jgi:hypothetical protein
MKASSTQAGVTLVEAVIAVVVLAPLLYSIFSVGDVARSSVRTQDIAAELDVGVDRIGRRLVESLRPAMLASLQARQSPAAAWEIPLPSQSYTGIHFASDDPAEPATAIQFVPDAGEIGNGADDDGDLLVDEGNLRSQRGTEKWVDVASGIELVNIVIAGRLITITVQAAKRDQGSRIMRVRREFTVCIRN